MRQNIFILLVLTVVFMSCGKKDTRFQLTGEYRPGTTGDVDAVVMYSDGGQITDMGTIRNLL